LVDRRAGGRARRRYTPQGRRLNALRAKLGSTTAPRRSQGGRCSSVFGHAGTSRHGTDGRRSGYDRRLGCRHRHVTGLLDALREDDKVDITAAVRPLTERFRQRGLGTVRVAAREILQDWIQLQTVVGPLAYLRVWGDDWAGPRSVDTRTFSGLLETLDQLSSYAWCDFFARHSDVDLAEPSLRAVYANARRRCDFCTTLDRCSRAFLATRHCLPHGG
jgi:hypothetical protein